MDAELACFVGGCGDHSALGRVARASYDDRQATEFRAPGHLDRGDELVEVEMEDPVRGGHRPHCASRVPPCRLGSGPEQPHYELDVDFPCDESGSRRHTDRGPVDPGVRSNVYCGPVDLDLVDEKLDGCLLPLSG
jgi:hypothetical protein